MSHRPLFKTNSMPSYIPCTYTHTHVHTQTLAVTHPIYVPHHTCLQDEIQQHTGPNKVRQMKAYILYSMKCNVYSKTILCFIFYTFHIFCLFVRYHFTHCGTCLPKNRMTKWDHWAERATEREQKIEDTFCWNQLITGALIRWDYSNVKNIITQISDGFNGAARLCPPA